MEVETNFVLAQSSLTTFARVTHTTQQIITRKITVWTQKKTGTWAPRQRLIILHYAQPKKPSQAGALWKVLAQCSSTAEATRIQQVPEKPSVLSIFSGQPVLAIPTQHSLFACIFPHQHSG